MQRLLWIPWRWWRRAAQLALLIGFLWLFRRTEYFGADELAGGENILFRLDPLLGATAMLGARQFIASFWPALAIVAITMLLGRFFCGWICPLGTLLDYFHRIVGPIAKFSPLSLWERARVRAIDKSILRSMRYVLLIAILLAAVFAYPLAGLLDPFSLLVRGMTFWGDPALYRGVDACFGSLSEGWATETLQPFVKKHLLPFREMTFHWAGVSAMLLGLIFALEFITRRFWCRYVCPTGALLGLCASRSLVKHTPPKQCKSCSVCTDKCRMNALDPGTVPFYADNTAKPWSAKMGLSPLPGATERLSRPDCILCMDCVDFCPKGISKIGYRFRKKGNVQPRPVDLSRRGVLAGIAAGAAMPGVAWAARLGSESKAPRYLVRPPGATADEKTFLNLCVRCGECMKVCPTNVLQPTIFQSGLEGLFSPRMDFRNILEQSFCEYSCTLCGQVCPTGAIPRLAEEAKHAQPNGKAYFDHNRCLPWAEKTPCIRCEEMCPVPDKAIKILNTFTIKGPDGQDVEIQQPYVERDLCVGCGICESNCTIEGVSAIRVQRIDAADPGTEFLLNKKPASENAKK
jgi:polyferredoxin